MRRHDRLGHARRMGRVVARGLASAARTARGLMARAAHEVADAILDATCAAGEHPLGVVAGPACPDCVSRLRDEGESRRCPTCSAAGAEGPCGACRARSRRVRVLAPRRHRGVARSLVLALKAGRREDVAEVLAAATWEDGAVRDAVGACEVLVPVPGDPVRRLERGFGHAEALARALAGCAGRGGRAPRVVEALAVGHRDGKQSTRSAAERRRALRRAMRLRPLARRAVRGRRVVLVDDVVTTGATLAEASRVLLRAGAASVDVVACTRADGPLIDVPPRRLP